MAGVSLKGLLAPFEAFAWKTLARVEAVRLASNQHEFNGVGALRDLLGSDRRVIRATVVYAAKDGRVASGGEIDLTWYDARERHPTRTEYRLYYPPNPAVALAHEGDLFVLIKLRSGGWWVVIAEAGGEVEARFRWLLGLQESVRSSQLRMAELRSVDAASLTLVLRELLAGLGLASEDVAPAALDEAIRPFVEAGRFPQARDFSRIARTLTEGVDPVQDPDSALVGWFEVEERMFMRLERALSEGAIENWRKAGTGDLDTLVALVQGLLQRRKSRAGKALENHVEALLEAHEVRYSRNPQTEGRHRPDFVMPSISDYLNPSFPPSRLTVLAVKSTVKDRWRQILNEAKRVPDKHLLTLQQGISGQQLQEMDDESVILVRPRGITSGVKQKGKSELTVAEFLGRVVKLQSEG